MKDFPGRGRLIGLLAKSFAAPRVATADGFLMELDCAEWLQLEILAKGSAEPLTLALLTQLLREGDTYIDVGAHVGHHSLVAARACGNTGRVIAIDPQPYNADRIARNAECNGLSNIATVCAAVGNRDQFVKLHLQNETDRARLSFSLPNPNDLNCVIEVPMRRLDTLLTAYDTARVKLLKVDVEGFELEVLEGLGGCIGDCENVIFELLEATEAYKARALIEYMLTNGFQLSDITGNPWELGQPLPEANVWASKTAL